MDTFAHPHPVVKRKHLFLQFQDPQYRPPVLDEMWPDLEKVIDGAAKRFSSSSCTELSYDMLISVGNEKLTLLLNKIEGDYCTPLGVVDCERACVPSMRRIKSRVDFFKYFKACLNNHIRALIHRHIYTEKRTGVRPPPKAKKGEIPDFDTAEIFTEIKNHSDEDAEFCESYRQSEVRLDNPDSHCQIACDADVGLTDQMAEDISHFLNPCERMILNSLWKPEAGVLLLTLLDSRRNKKNDNVRVLHGEEHHAEALGFPLYVFRKIKSQVEQKVLNYMKTGEALLNKDVIRKDNGEYDEEETCKFNNAKAKLCELFDMEIPDYIDKMVLRRAFTIAARDQDDKVLGKPDVIEMLQIVGAKVPVKHAETICCFGVLYKSDNKACCACHRRKACAVEASNYGLGEITLSPQLLGSKLTRIPVIMSHDQSVDSRRLPDFANDRDEEVFHYLCENFEKFSHKGETSFRHKDSGMDQAIFVFDAQSKFRFCRPSEKLQSELTKNKNSWYLPDDSTVDDSVELIQQHAKETFVLSDTEGVADEATH